MISMFRGVRPLTVRAALGAASHAAPFALLALAGVAGCSAPADGTSGETATTTNEADPSLTAPAHDPGEATDDDGGVSATDPQAWWFWPIPVRDAGVRDTGAPAVDAGRDAGSGTVDAGRDTGTPGVDASAPPDAAPRVDASAPVDAAPPVDSGTTTSGGARIPSPTGACPTIGNTGGGSTVLTFAGQSVTIWAGAKAAKPGPLVIYWYATGGSPSQASQVLGSTLSKITAAGGIVAAQNATNKQGQTTGNNVWYTGDISIADEVVACAVQQGYSDPSRVHVLGYSAGALQTVYHSFARSGYVASVVSYSGGEVGINKTAYQDPTNVPPAVAAHGASGSDALGVDFAAASQTWENDIRSKNGFVIDCNDGSNHTDLGKRTAIAPNVWQFFQDHPFKVKPEPYAGGLPGGWPSYCSVVK